MTDDERADLADLAMRALDTILDDYGDEAVLCCACLVYEVKTTDEDGDDVWHGNWVSLKDASPHHVGGLLANIANHVVAE
jgi:hypothetical protein